MEMAESAALIRNESARRYVDGRMGRRGVVMLYPDRLASVNVRTTRWGGQFAVETLVVTTADGTEYGFRGRIGSLPTEIAGPLAGLGREVRATPLGLAVTPQPVSQGA